MLKLTLVPNMWTHEGGELTQDDPVRFQILGLPPGEEAEVARLSRNSLWQLKHTSKTGEVVVDNYESPEEALTYFEKQFPNS